MSDTAWRPGSSEARRLSPTGLGGHLPGQDRHDGARQAWRERRRRGVGVGLGGKDHRVRPHSPAGSVEAPATAGALEAGDRRPLVHGGAVALGRRCEAAGKGEGVDVPARGVEHPAVPEIGAEDGARPFGVDELGGEAEAAPRIDAALAEADAAGRVRRLEPAGPLGLRVDPLLLGKVEEDARAVADQPHEPLAGLTVALDDGVRLGGGERRDDLPVVAPDAPQPTAFASSRRTTVPRLARWTRRTGR